MRPTKVKPAPSVSMNPFEQNASSSHDSVVSHPSSSSDSTFPHPSSPKGSLFPDPSAPKGPPVLDSPSPRGSMASDTSSRSFLSPEPFLPRRSISLNIQPSDDSLGQDLLFLSDSLQQMTPKEKSPVLKLRVPVTKAKELKSDYERPNWLCAAIALLIICTLLLSMVSLMSVKASELDRTLTEQMEMMTLQILVLSETLTELQMGKVRTCTMCKIQWVQHADLCFLFSDLGMAWQTSKDICMEESSTLAIMETKAEMEFLRAESNRYFIVLHGKYYYYHKFWIGLEYNNSSSVMLLDGTLLDLTPSAKVVPHPCIYLQNGKFLTKPCNKMHRFICKTKVKFG